MMQKSPYISSLITLIDGFGDPWGLKTPDSVHIYMNREARRFTCTPESFDPEGHRDSEFPAAWAELEDDLIAHDHQACCTANASLVIETHYWYGTHELMPYLSEKRSVYDENQHCVAILWNAKPILLIDPLLLIDNQRPGIIKTSIANTPFTAAEKETIFYLQQGLSAKEIARIKNLSCRTINNRTQTIFQKAGVHSLLQLKEYCRHAGFSDYVPPQLIQKGVTLIR